ncbi:hypothetical protein OC834_002908 [Tilletia horrida]|nr:hypothetical protein OC834_002908 [Tilletia horrida]KAK0536741.1 hypothetical protein OC835_001932 [Tilletia horrida]KAK0560936.1 hypothetical protein OC844_003488 [Tilletia horrida]
MTTDARKHLALIAAPGLGHVIPLLRLAHVLAARGLLVTFIVSDVSLEELQRRKLPEACVVPDSLRLFPVSSAGKVSGTDVLTSPLTIMSLYLAMIQPVSALIDDLCSGRAGAGAAAGGQAWPAIRAIVSSPFIFFGPGAARAHPHVRWTTLIDMSVAGCIVTQRLAEAALEETPPAQLDDASKAPVLLQSGVDIALSDTQDSTQTPVRSSIHIPEQDLVKVFGEKQLAIKSPTVGLATGFRKLFIDSDDILINTTTFLDGPLLPQLQTRLAKDEYTCKTLYAIGPIDLALMQSQCAHLESTSRSINSEEEEEQRQEQQVDVFLASSPPRSVLYIAFGSVVSLPAPEMAKLVNALHSVASSSPLPFILVSHPLHSALSAFANGSDAAIEDGLKGAMEQLRPLVQQNRGIVLSWAPQRRILSHPSTGLFLSHGGWNSSLEALSYDVPLLLRPLNAEQVINARMLTEHLAVAHHVVSSDSIESAHTPQDRNNAWTFKDALQAFAALHRSTGAGEASSTIDDASRLDCIRKIQKRAAEVGAAIRRDAGVCRGEGAEDAAGAAVTTAAAPNSSVVALEAWLANAGLA